VLLRNSPFEEGAFLIKNPNRTIGRQQTMVCGRRRRRQQQILFQRLQICAINSKAAERRLIEFQLTGARVPLGPPPPSLSHRRAPCCLSDTRLLKTLLSPGRSGPLFAAKLFARAYRPAASRQRRRRHN
jgi:hypothetical protein